MGVYMYLYCPKHKEYVHLGKAGRKNYECPETSYKFINNHLLCSVWIINDSHGEDKLYCEAMGCNEFVGE